MDLSSASSPSKSMFLLGIGAWAPEDRLTEQFSDRAMKAAYHPDKDAIVGAMPLPESTVDLAIEHHGVIRASLKHQAGPGDGQVEDPKHQGDTTLNNLPRLESFGEPLDQCSTPLPRWRSEPQFEEAWSSGGIASTDSANDDGSSKAIAFASERIERLAHVEALCVASEKLFAFKPAYDS